MRSLHLSRLPVNSLWLLLSRLGTQLGMALFTVLLARGLGSTLFGEYAFMASVIVIGNVLTTFGTDMHLIREIAATDDLSPLAPALAIQLILSAVFIAFVGMGSAILRGSDAIAATALRIYSLSMLPLAFYTVFTTALRGRQHMGAYALLNLALMLLQVLAALWLFWRHAGLLDVALLMLMVQLGGALVAGLLCALHLPDFRLSWTSRPEAVLLLLEASAPIALLGLLGVIYQRSALVLLPALAGAAVTGWFSAAARLIEAAKLGHVAVFTAIYPLMAQSRVQQRAVLPKSIRVAGWALLAAAVLASLALCFLADILIPLLYGTHYAPAIPAVRILAWTLVPYAINSFFTLAFLAHGEETAVARILAVSVLSLILLTVWWAPVAGITGAAWAALCAELLQALLLTLTDLRRMHVIPALLDVGTSP